MDKEQAPENPGNWRWHLDQSAEFWRLAAGGKRELAPLAEREFSLALEQAPPSLENHLILLEVAAGNGRLEEVKGLYYLHEQDWPFVPAMMARIAAIEEAQAVARQMPVRVRHPADLIQFGHFAFTVADILVWFSRRRLGSRGPLILALLLFSLMLYLQRDFIYAMYLLWTAY